MKLSNTDRVRRVTVSDPVAAASPYDYADAFELRLDAPDDCSPEDWVRAGIDAVPAWIKRLANARDGVAGMRAARSEADLVVFEDGDALMDTLIIGRTSLDGHRRVLTTVLRYRRPWLARAVWAIVGIVHRRVAPTVVAGGLDGQERFDEALLQHA